MGVAEGTHYFYVLLCKDQTLYAGYTTDLKRRTATHNQGQGAKYTRSRRPVQLIYAEQWDDKSSAMSAEYRFKQLTRPAKMRYLAAHGQRSILPQSTCVIQDKRRKEPPID